MEVLQVFGSWDQEIDLWFTNHEPLIPTLHFKCNYLKNQRHFAAFYCFFEIYTKFATFEKNWAS